MTKFRGTPGPWRKDRFGQLIGANGKRVVECNSGIMSSLASKATRQDEEVANAIVRNAAPDLLQALIRLEAHTRILPEDYDAPESAMRQARTAIARALGKEKTE